MVRVAMGSDTGGSIRGPAAWCGLSGIKPTYGRVSRRGVFPLSWTLDHCGPLSRSVEDSAITLGVIAGHDPGDPASADVSVRDYLTDLNKGVSGLRVGIPRAFFQAAPAATPDVLAGIDRTADQLRAAGATVEDITLPDYALFAAAGRIIMMGEAYAIHEANVRSRLLDYGEITANRFVLGATVLAADYINGLRARRELTDAVNAALSRYDVLLTASALCTAPRFDASMDAMSSASPMQTIPFNVTGHPAMSVPVGLASDGLPIGVQIVGRPFDEATVFRVCRAVEVFSGWEKVALPV
jgi:aspartyl-tRNA(Asn)/glutamyl-tRNA(Gln) amidotransferase subunit A